jgi:hypothetical protein
MSLSFVITICGQKLLLRQTHFLEISKSCGNKFQIDPIIKPHLSKSSKSSKKLKVLKAPNA